MALSISAHDAAPRAVEPAESALLSQPMDVLWSPLAQAPLPNADAPVPVASVLKNPKAVPPTAVDSSPDARLNSPTDVALRPLALAATPTAVA